ncbi:unnamed protein product [Choristocarpus tenellus]
MEIPYQGKGDPSFGHPSVEGCAVYRWDIPNVEDTCMAGTSPLVTSYKVNAFTSCNLAVLLLEMTEHGDSGNSKVLCDDCRHSLSHPSLEPSHLQALCTTTLLLIMVFESGPQTDFWGEELGLTSNDRMSEPLEQCGTFVLGIPINSHLDNFTRLLNPVKGNLVYFALVIPHSHESPPPQPLHASQSL